MGPKFYVTTAIVYANATPHVGFAYEVIAADVIARYKRLNGFDVFFLTGMDENSLNVERKAASLGKSPGDYCDEMAEVYKQVFEKISISNDGFIRTTSEEHRRCAQDLVSEVNSKGDIYKGVYEGWYCPSCEYFIQGEDLIQGLCPVHKTKPEWIKEDNFFFALSGYQEKLIKHIDSHPQFIQPEARRNEIVNMIKAGLKDISVSRSTLKWGIPFPLDPGHVIYVWFDALVNYLSGIGKGTDEEKFQRYWPADVHIIGKDITRFHCIIWPAMLMSAGLPIPQKVFGHGFLNIEGAKISKTAGNIVDPVALAEEFGADALRYFLLREIPFGSDGDFSEDALKRRMNADLANDLGNLVSRVLKMAEDYCGARVPARDTSGGCVLNEIAEKLGGKLDGLMTDLKFSEVLTAIWNFIREANRYVEKEAPWQLNKQSKKDRLNEVMYNSLEAVRLAGALIAPFMPGASGKIAEKLGISKEEMEQPMEKLTRWGNLTAGKVVSKGDALFPRLKV